MPGLVMDTERLDVRIARQFALSRRKAQDVIAAGQVDVDSKRARDPGQRVAAEQAVAFNPHRRRETAVRFSLPVAHHDEELVVVDKPPGLLTVPTDAGLRDDSVLTRLRADLEKTRGPRAYVGALHRLDRGTSGLVAMALSRECHAAGRAAFRDHAFLRRYLALVEGVPREKQGTIDLKISDEYDSGKRHIVLGDAEPSRRAITHYRVKESFARAALLEVELDTGRQHQIRLHLRAIGHPIIGDGVYGTEERKEGSRPFLHACLLSFPHPISAAPIHCESPLPRDFAEAVARLAGSRGKGYGRARISTSSRRQPS